MIRPLVDGVARGEGSSSFAGSVGEQLSFRFQTQMVRTLMAETGALNRHCGAPLTRKFSAVFNGVSKKWQLFPTHDYAFDLIKPEMTTA